jgi:hypothetical protein
MTGIENSKPDCLGSNNRERTFGPNFNIDWDKFSTRVTRHWSLFLAGHRQQIV